MDTNGNGRALGGPIPILGQPCKMLSFVPTLLLQCNCEGKHPLLAIGCGAIVQCPGCKRRVIAQAIHMENGRIHVQVGLVLTPDEAAQQLAPAGSVS